METCPEMMVVLYRTNKVMSYRTSNQIPDVPFRRFSAPFLPPMEDEVKKKTFHSPRARVVLLIILSLCIMHPKAKSLKDT